MHTQILILWDGILYLYKAQFDSHENVPKFVCGTFSAASTKNSWYSMFIF